MCSITGMSIIFHHTVSFEQWETRGDTSTTNNTVSGNYRPFRLMGMQFCTSELASSVFKHLGMHRNREIVTANLQIKGQLVSQSLGSYAGNGAVMTSCLLCQRQAKGKCKVVPVLFLNWTPCHEGVLGSGGIALYILDLSTRWRWVVGFTPRPL
jgi:hypothetical protein